MVRSRVALSVLSAIGLLCAIGASPATPSYIAVEAAIKKIQTELTPAPSATPNPQAANWIVFCNAVKGDLLAYAGAKRIEDRTKALSRLEAHAQTLTPYAWPPAAELRNSLIEWLRPRHSLAWAEQRLADAVRLLPPSEDQSIMANRQRWLTFLSEDLWKPQCDFEAAVQVRDRRAALNKLHAELDILQKQNQKYPWAPSLGLQAAVEAVFNGSNIDASADAASLSRQFANNLVTTGPVERRGQVAYVTAGPWLGWGLLSSDDGIAFYNQQRLSSVTPVRGFQEQIAADQKGKRAAKMYQFGATTYDQGVVTAYTVLRTTGIALGVSNSHLIRFAVSSMPAQGGGMQRMIASLLGFNQKKITNEVYKGAIGQVREGTVQGSIEEGAERSAAAAAERNAQLTKFLIGNNTLVLNPISLTRMQLWSRPDRAYLRGNAEWFGSGLFASGAELPRPGRFNLAEPGIVADVHISSVINNLLNGFFGSERLKNLTNLMIVTRKTSPDAPPADRVLVRENVDYATFLKEIDEARKADDPNVLAVRVIKPSQPPEFCADREGRLIALLHGVAIEVPAPTAANRGGITGPPAKVFRLEFANAEVAISFEVQPATGTLPVRISGRVENFEAGPGAKVFALNDDESKPVELNAISRTLVLGIATRRIKGQPIDQPLSALNLPGYTLRSVSPLDPTGWLRIVLMPN